MTIISFTRLSVGRYSQTPVKYMFSESVRIVDYNGKVIKSSKIVKTKLK